MANPAGFPPISSVKRDRKPTETYADSVSNADIRGDDIVLAGVIPGLNPYIYSQTKNILVSDTDPSEFKTSNKDHYTSFLHSDSAKYDNSAAGFKKYLDDILSNSTVKLACCAKREGGIIKDPNGGPDIKSNITYIKIPSTDKTNDPVQDKYGYD